jgi:hypothetical protein
MVAVPPEKLLLVEVRDEINRRVSFSALNYGTNSFLWEDFVFDDSWWTSLLAAQGSILLIHTYTNPDNPDAKTLHALDLSTRQPLWQIKEFSFTRFIRDRVEGLLGTQDPHIVQLNIFTGEIIEKDLKLDEPVDKISEPFSPFQYLQGSSYYDSVNEFLLQYCDRKAEGTIEYLEHEGLIFISYHVRETGGLVNYLLVMNEEGKHLYHEKIDDQLKGLGVDTFFILSGCLIFVRNKRELLSYHIL